MPPVPRPGKILAMGSNYLEGTQGPPLPIWAFVKSPDAIIGPGDTIVLPDVPARIFHHEAELVAIIGKKGKNISREAAPSYVCGYTRSEEHTSELQSLMRNSYAVFCLTKNTTGADIRRKEQAPKSRTQKSHSK